MSDNKKIAISIQNVSKDFKLPHHNQPSSIKSIFVNPFRSKQDKTTANYDEKQHALKDINFDIYEGEFFGIVGKNGSGKSTLLKIIAGIYKPNQGAVKYSGKLVPFIELGVGFNPELTGRDNVYLSGALMGYSVKEIEAKYESIVEFAELERFMDQLLKNYSSGMQVRLAFSVATILGDSDILLIDEVLAVGDADFQRKCFSYFKKLKKDNKTVVFVSHDMSAVREYCDRAVLLDESRIVKLGDTESVAQKYTKLFSDSGGHTNWGDEGARWGSRNAQTSKIEVRATDKLVTVTQHIRANESVDNPIIGIRIRSISGESVTGTNSKIEKTKTGVIDQGEEIKLVWTIPNIFADGEYYADPAILANDGITVYDWWDEAVKFSIKKDRNLPYLIDPGFSMNILK